MIKNLLIKFIKVLMMTTPFLSLLLMVLALWGVGGKASYIDLNAVKQQEKFALGEAKNVLVNETKPAQLCPPVLGESPDADKAQEKAGNKDQLPENIDWEHVI